MAAADALTGEDLNRLSWSVDQVRDPDGILHDRGQGTAPSGLSFFVCKRGLDKQFSATSRDPHYDLHHHVASLHPSPTNRVLPLGLIWKEEKRWVDGTLLPLPSGLSCFYQFWILSFLQRVC